MPDKMSIEDLLLDESFINYCKGSSAKDTVKWKLFVQQNPASREEIEVARRKYHEIFAALAVADQTEQEALLKEKLSINSAAPVVSLYKGNETTKRWNTKNVFSMMVKLTAAAMIVFTAGYFAVNLIHTKKQIVTSFISPNGERKSFQLPDGSEVMLNAGSKMTIDKHYGEAMRDVYLEGEAFFDVKHNSKAPFIVHTKTMDIKALGTAFNVKAYPGEQITETSLIRGSVEVTLRNEAGHKVILHPNEKVSWFEGKKEGDATARKPSEKTTPTARQQISNDYIVQALSKNQAGGVKELAWTENKLEFTNETFGQIAQMMERWYGIKIEFEDSNLRQYRFTGTFEKEKIETVLSILKESRNFNYKIISGDTLMIRLYQ